MNFGGLGQPNHKHIVDADGNPIISDHRSMSLFAVFIAAQVVIGLAQYWLLGDILSAMVRFGISTVLSVSITVAFANWAAKKAKEKRHQNEISNRSIAAKFEEKQIEERRKRAEKSGRANK